MSAVFDIDNTVDCYLWLSVIILNSRSSIGAQYIYLSNSSSSLLNKPELSGDKLSNLTEYLLFEGKYLVACTEYSVLGNFQFIGYESLTVCKSLFSDVMIGYQIIVGFCDLDIISENPVIADLQVLDACLFLFSLGNIIYQTFSARNDIPQTVKLFIETLADHSAVLDICRRFVNDGIFNKV